ncbi:MAG: hypothetical protein JXB62_10545 [Pirellulales bacterium]|nr:hypothetical protein [Pirellulales bacterium]
MATVLLDSPEPSREDVSRSQAADARPRVAGSQEAPSKGFTILLLAVLAAYVGGFVYATGDCFVDDAYIGFQYLRNWIAGDGFVFNVGDPAVEGVTNIGWLLLLAPFAAAGGPMFAAKAVGLALVLCVLALTHWLGRALAARSESMAELSGLALVPVVLLATSFDFVYFSVAGMETALLAAVLLLMAWVALRRPGSLWLPVIGTYAFLVHPETVLVYPFYCLLSLTAPNVDVRRLLLGNLVLAALLGTVTGVRYAVFHDVVPNTFHSKPSDWSQIVAGGYGILMGRSQNIPFPITGWLALPVLALGYVRLRRLAPGAAAMLGAITLSGFAFAVYSPPDWTQMARYFAPYLPAVLIVFWAGLIDLTERLLRRASQSTVPALVRLGVTAVLVLTGLFYGSAKMAAMESFPGYILSGRNLVGPSIWIRDHLPDGATVASRRIGALAYYSRKRVFDYTYGLPDRQVAGLVADIGHRIDLPTDPALAPLWKARSPDYLLEDRHVIDLILSDTGGSDRRFAIHGRWYRVAQRFPIGRDQQWLLAERIVPERPESGG